MTIPSRPTAAHALNDDTEEPEAAPAAEARHLPTIAQPYLLVLFSVPFHVDEHGERWIDVLWAKDLLEHTRYIEQLTLAAPAVRRTPPANAKPMSAEGLRQVRCVDLPAPSGIGSALRGLPRTCAILWKELGRARLVHTGLAGWPWPEAWLLVPMLALRRRCLFVNVESAFWRPVPGARTSFGRRLRARLMEALNRRCVERADISTFTHRGYLQTLLRRGSQRGHVIEASWIDEQNVLTPVAMRELQERRERRRAPLRVMFAGRLTEAKGILLLLDAIAGAARAGFALELDVYGTGPLEAECAARCRHEALASRVRLHGSVPYDDSFFAILREHDVLVVPTLSDEQPRVVFDAYSQGLPVIASETEGLVQCVEDHVTGLFFARGDVVALQSRLVEVIERPGLLTEMSDACVRRARGLTHRRMHWKRWKLLIESFPWLAARSRIELS